MLNAVRKLGYSLQCASEECQNDKEVRQAGHALEYSSEELRNDREVVLAAVRQSGESLWYTREMMKGDKAVVLESVKQSQNSLCYASRDLLCDNQFLWKLLRVDVILFSIMCQKKFQMTRNLSYKQSN